MNVCIFCKEEFSPQNNIPEHILLNCLGGRKETVDVDCSVCNRKFGRTIDRAVNDGIVVIRNLLNLKKGRKKNPPTIKGLKLSDGKPVSFLPGGRPEYSKAVTKIEKLGKEKVKYHISAPNFKKIKKILSDVAKPFGLSEKEIIEQIVNSGSIEMERRYINEPLSLSLTLQDELQIRSHLKSILVLWALEVGNDEVLNSSYQTARDYVYKGTASIEIGNLDFRDFPFLSFKTKNYGSIWNLILVQSNEKGRVHAVFRLYNSISWLFDLGQSDQFKNLTVGLVSNPENNVDWELFKLDQATISTDWFTSPISKVGELHVLKYANEILFQKGYNKIIELAQNKLNITEGDLVTPEIWHRLIRTIIEEFFRFNQGLKYNEVMDNMQALECLNEYSEKSEIPNNKKPKNDANK